MIDEINCIQFSFILLSIRKSHWTVDSEENKILLVRDHSVHLFWFSRQMREQSQTEEETFLIRASICCRWPIVRLLSMNTCREILSAVRRIKTIRSPSDADWNESDLSFHVSRWNRRRRSMLIIVRAMVTVQLHVRRNMWRVTRSHHFPQWLWLISRRIPWRIETILMSQVPVTMIFPWLILPRHRRPPMTIWMKRILTNHPLARIYLTIDLFTLTLRQRFMSFQLISSNSIVSPGFRRTNVLIFLTSSEHICLRRI